MDLDRSAILPPVPNRPPLAAHGGRRHRSRQRDRLLDLLRSTDRHPTAAWLHEALQREFPRVSLATVYRNLEILVAEGHAREVPSVRGPARYDGNRAPHHHFLCEGCGAIEDIDLRLPSGLTARVRRRYRVTPTRFRVDFYGLCGECTDRTFPQP